MTERIRVGDVLKLERRPVSVDPLEEYRLIGVYSFGNGIFHREPALGATLGDYRFFAIAPGDLVLSNIQAWEGAIGLASQADHGTIGTHRFLAYVPRDDRIDTNWARWFFLSEPGMSLIRKAAPGSTVRNRTLAIDRFEALEILLPPINEQRLVATRLDHLSASVDRLVGRFRRLTPESARALLPPFVDGLLGHNSRARAKVGDLVDFVSDRVDRGDDPAPATVFIGPNYIESHTGRCLGSDPVGADTGPKLRFRPGDIIYLKLRPYLNKVWIADRHGLCSSDQIVLRPMPGYDIRLIAHALRSSSVLTEAMRLTSSLQLPRIRKASLAGIEAPTDGIPSGDLGERLDQTRDRVISLAGAVARRQRTKEALIPAYLNEAFAGS
jgi:type I restriction enzyme, S subunit